ncbi:MAG TPA: hypothetical protein VGJ15_02920 [Pirellulales bacterium]|jgi:hypothetical protein
METIAVRESNTVSEHGHHKIAAALFVGSLIIGSALVLAAELTKPSRYEYHQWPNDPNGYVIFDNETGRATAAKTDSEHPLAPLGK